MSVQIVYQLAIFNKYLTFRFTNNSVFNPLSEGYRTSILQSFNPSILPSFSPSILFHIQIHYNLFLGFGG